MHLHLSFPSLSSLYMFNICPISDMLFYFLFPYSWKIPWMEEPGGLQSMGSLRVWRLSNFTFTFHFHALEKEMAIDSNVLAWRTPVTGKPGGVLSMGSHRVGHDWSDLAAAGGPLEQLVLCEFNTLVQLVQQLVLCEWVNLEADPPVPTSPSNDYSPLHALMQTPPQKNSYLSHRLVCFSPLCYHICHLKYISRALINYL